MHAREIIKVRGMIQAEVLQKTKTERENLQCKVSSLESKLKESALGGSGSESTKIRKLEDAVRSLIAERNNLKIELGKIKSQLGSSNAVRFQRASKHQCSFDQQKSYGL